MNPVNAYFIAGQCQGTGYTLWDIAPAPIDLTRRAVMLEELEVEAADALGTVNVITGPTARAALDGYLADIRQYSGQDDYALTADSNLDGIDAADPVTATARTGARTRMVGIHAAVVPGPASLAIYGASSYDTGVKQRIERALTAAGHEVKGETAVAIDFHRQLSSSLDLAIVCAVLATSGRVDQAALDRTALIGELGSGRVGVVPGITASVTTAIAAGITEIIVPRTADAQLRETTIPPTVRIHRVSTVAEAVQALHLIVR
ncbi:magnesium chelatase domain-containing protein [Streptomyces sp. NPDC019990]|uniref:magnesium chelatase domain-containing protein n=1 Tax=Streptomyces sp. NPDC019990 TaxID=3154693 RepID=UPI0033DDCCED